MSALGLRPGALALCVVALLAGCEDVVPAPSAFADDDGVVGGDGGASGDVLGDADTVVDAGADAGKDAATDAGKDAADKDAAADAVADADASPDADATPDAADADTAGPTCVAAACPGEPPPCKAWTCVDDACALAPVADGAPCDDGLACTDKAKTACSGGACVSVNKNCACLEDGDCQDDGDLCNGTMYCDTSTSTPSCKVNPATVVSCPSVNDTECVTNTCDNKTGGCEMVPIKKLGVACDDGNPCTKDAVCGIEPSNYGTCGEGTNACGCTKQADCTGSDKNIGGCVGQLYCDLAGSTPQCKVDPATVVACADDGNPCTTVACDKTNGKCVTTTVAENGPCDDGDACTTETCIGGQCTPSASKCGCKTDKDCQKFGPKENLCAGSLYCDKSDPGKPQCKVNPATVTVCSTADDSSCKSAYCEPSTGQCSYKLAAKFTLCDDGAACTASDSCDGKGACVPGTFTCVCQQDSDCADKEDGDICNGTLYCDKSATNGACKVNPATIVGCAGTGDACKLNLCDPKTGACAISDATDGTDCKDGTECVEKGSCKGGTCYTSIVNCGCVSDADCDAKEDGNLCNGALFCDKSGEKSKWHCVTKPQSQVSCQASGGGSCIQPTCNPKTGTCEPVASDAHCPAPGNPCLLAICGAKDGKCTTQPVADGLACGPQSACVAGACKAIPAEMVLIAKSKGFVGCSPQDTNCDANEGKATEVDVATFAIDRFEVTVADFDKNCPNCALKPASTDAGCNASDKAKASHPANCVTWDAANAYCQSLGKQLPTEAQWERAARGGCELWGGGCASATPIYPWNTPVASCAYTVMVGDTGPGCGAGGSHPAGSFSKDDSPYGVRDMGGNVREWTADGYTASPWDGAPKQDPAVASGSGALVVKGGAFDSKGVDVRSSRRASEAPGASLPNVGFRCVRKL